MFCITINGTPTSGIIHNPFLDQTYKSFRPEDTVQNGLAQKEDLHRIIISRSHAENVKEIIGNKIDSVQVIPAGGSGFKTINLIENNADLYLHTSKIYKWDICAPNAIINNMGGRLVERSTGKSVDFSFSNKETNSVNGIIASFKNSKFYENLFVVE
jgi:Golgi-resident PAP phosphatase